MAEITYNGDGTTTDFATGFPVLADSDLTVYVDDAVVAPSGYSVSGAGFNSASATVSFNDAPPTGTGNVRLRRSSTIGRVTDFSQTTSWNSEALNDEFDAVLTQLQDASDVADTALSQSITNAADIASNDADIADLQARALIEDLADSKFDAESKVIKNVAQPTDSNDAARLADVSAAASTGLPDKTGNANKYLRVTNDELAEIWSDAPWDSDNLANPFNFRNAAISGDGTVPITPGAVPGSAEQIILTVPSIAPGRYLCSGFAQGDRTGGNNPTAAAFRLRIDTAGGSFSTFKQRISSWPIIGAANGAGLPGDFETSTGDSGNIDRWQMSTWLDITIDTTLSLILLLAVYAQAGPAPTARKLGPAWLNIWKVEG